MNNSILFEFNYNDSNHLRQINTGLEILAKKGIIKLKINYDSRNSSSIFKVWVNNIISVIYDCYDGINWIDNSRENTLNFFKAKIQAEYVISNYQANWLF